MKKKGGEGGTRTKYRCKFINNKQKCQTSKFICDKNKQKCQTSKFICDKNNQKCQTSPILLETVLGSCPLWCYFILAIVTQFKFDLDLISTVMLFYTHNCYPIYYHWIILAHPAATKIWIISPVCDDFRCYRKLGSRDFAWNYLWK